MTPFLAVLGLVVAQRLLELVHAGANSRRLLARGAVEVGRGHYPLFVLLHAGWLLCLLLSVPVDAEPRPVPLVLLGAAMVGRVWVIGTLGPFWTTRIITLPGAPLVRRGPYRLLRHPNYWVVAAEIALLPLAFDAAWIAIPFSTLNGALLAYRVTVEDKALAPRRSGPASAFPVLSARGSSAASG